MFQPNKLCRFAVLACAPLLFASLPASHRSRLRPSLSTTSRRESPTSGSNALQSARTGGIAVPEMRNRRLFENYGKLPLSFELNRGQTDPQVKFLSRGRGYAMFLTSEEAVLSLRGSGKSDLSVEASARKGNRNQNDINRQWSVVPPPAGQLRKTTDIAK